MSTVASSREFPFMRVVHLMASPFYGGPERQMLGLARHLPSGVESVFLSFAERGLGPAVPRRGARLGYEAKAADPQHAALFRVHVGEVAEELRRLNADLLCVAAATSPISSAGGRRGALGIPVVSISHGWTAATWRVRGYEKLDRWVLRAGMDAVVCVSKAQADKVRRRRGAGNEDRRHTKCDRRRRRLWSRCAECRAGDDALVRATSRAG